MQPDYSQLWRSMDNGQSPDAQFYTFFEDSLNQFISTNTNPTQSAKNTEEQDGSLNNKQNIE
jgi:hypothetical protein